MPPWIVSTWAGAAAAAVAVVGAVAVYWIHPEVFRLGEAPAVVASAPAPSPDRTPPASEPLKAAPESPPAPAVIKPTFDVVRVEPTGETVIAGRAAPNARVQLLDGNRVLAEATAGRNGEFVILPDALAPGAHELTLATGEGASEHSRTISVSVASPPAPTAVASAAPMPTGAGKVAGQTVSVAVKSVERGPGGSFVVKGAASPSAAVRLYLSGAFVGDAKAAGDGHWSLTILHGVTPGPYSVRADEINPADASVIARAEAPFDYPHGPSGEGKGNAARPAASAADVVIDSVQTAHVEPGNTLWGLSQTFYGDGARYQLIFAANTGQIRDPNLIYPGQTFVVLKEAPKP